MTPTKAKPREVNGVVFRCYRVVFTPGRTKYHWISGDNVRIEQRKENVFVAWLGEPHVDNCIGNKFRTFETAAKAVIKSKQEIDHGGDMDRHSAAGNRKMSQGREAAANYPSADIERGLQWYREHKDHVQRLIQNGRAGLSIQNEFPMSGSDISRPELWKAGAWRWFLRRYEN